MGFHPRSNPKLSDILNASDKEPSPGLNGGSYEGKRTEVKEEAYVKGTEDRSVQTGKSKISANSVKSEDSYLISTSSPEGIAAASQITPSRIARILLSEGPLPIRRLTSQLISEVPAFGHLSLSKQRRLIMAALEAGDASKNCVFDKIGWGQWEAKIVPASQFAARVAAANSIAASSKNGSGIAGSTSKSKARRRSSTSQTTKNSKSLSSSNLPLHRNRRRTSERNSASPNSNGASYSKPLTIGQMAGLSSSAPSTNAGNGYLSSAAFRRESITNPKTDLHNLKVPGSPSLQPLRNLRNSLKAQNLSLDEAIESSSDEDDNEEAIVNSGDSSGSSPGYNSNGTGNEEGGVFSFENGDSSNTVRNILRTRSLSSSNSKRPSFGGIAKLRKPRSSFTSHTIEAALDESAMDGGHQRLSFSNPSSVSRQSYLRTAIPRRGIRQPRSQKVAQQLQVKAEDNDNFTDEEDWEAIGASSLRNGNHSASSLNRSPSPIAQDGRKQKEMNAAIALMNLHTVS